MISGDNETKYGQKSTTRTTYKSEIGQRRCGFVKNGKRIFNPRKCLFLHYFWLLTKCVTNKMVVQKVLRIVTFAMKSK